MRDLLRNAIQSVIDLARNGQRSRIRTYLAELDELVAAEEWGRAIARAKQAAEVASHAKHFGLVSRIGRVLEQLGEFEDAASIRFAAERNSYGYSGPIWNREDIAGRTLMIDQVFNHLGQQLRHARLIEPAVRHSGKCIVLAEPRLVPILQRTFAGATIVDQTNRRVTARTADLVTNYWDLAKWFANSAAKLEAGFVPLKPDADLVHLFRMQYAAQSPRPLVGISWSTSNKSRQTATLDDWGVLLSGFDATFVSLQYGNVEREIDILSKPSNAGILNDRSVDQLTNMDRFAAQVASLDLVVTVDNTIAHTAAALGKRTIVMTDDGPSHWPLRGDRTPWYPAATVVRRRGRKWKEVAVEARRRAEAELLHRPIRAEQ